MIQALPTFPIHKTTIKELLTRSRHPHFVYGVLTNRSNKIEGYFTHRHLLQYIEQQYDDLDDNPNNLQSFSRFVAKDFMIIHHESIPTAFPLHTTLLIIEQPAKTFSYIDERHFYQAVAQQQQIRTHHYDTIFDAMSSGLVAVNNEGIITMFNHAAEALYSLKHGEAMGKFLLDVSESDGLLRVLKTGKGHVEKYALQDRWFITYREPIYNGKQLIGAVSVFDDISKIESLTSELQLYKELVQENDALMANSEHGVGILDSKGTVLRENEQFHHFYVAILYNEQLRTKLFTLLQQVSHMQKPSYTTNFHLDDGRTLNLRFARIPDDAQKRIIIRIRDETTEYNFNVKAERLRNSVHHYFSVPYNERLVATTPDMQRVIEKIDSAAKGSAPVMILGEHGSGRSIIAAEIVRRSDRNDELFIEIDCMKESRERLEHLIFAKKHFSYYFIQVVKNGTLFFKNIDYLPLDMQKRLAQLIIHQSEREAADLEILNARLLASMQQPVQFERFDEQLFYLLNTISITMPSVQERTEELPLIFEQFLATLNDKYARRLYMSQAALDTLCAVALQHSIAYAKHCLMEVVSHFDGQIIDAAHIQQPTDKQLVQQAIVINELLPLKETIELVEKEVLRLASAKHSSYRKIAKQLEVNPSTIVRKIKKYNL
ncbi:sigma 54-interacting transcriptional regulator [Kurthia sp. Dielmo]|uniref:sigma 54-interacting transcriptional regulator n=1 Tax=Kurthia sp. Dielmo TaxID=1033738 RepID=UPI0011227776|nr:sigma 54-interacting transcriptional regulator [Kurthia sp. Dielmo]